MASAGAAPITSASAAAGAANNDAGAAAPVVAPRAAPWRHCLVIAAVGIGAGLALPDQFGLLARIAIAGIFVLSLDLIVGYAGLATLGHAALFGTGAYAAGLAALRLTAEPFTGLAIGAGAGAVVAGLSALFLLRYSGFTLLMLTVAVAPRSCRRRPIAR